MISFEKEKKYVHLKSSILCMGGRARGDTEPIKRKPKSLAIPVWDIIFDVGRATKLSLSLSVGRRHAVLI